MGIVIILWLAYHGIPMVPLKKKGYQPPSLYELSEKVHPVYEKGNDVGILLLHSFEGTSWEMKELGNYLSNSGYTISIPLLPGHGTTIDDLVQTDFEDWYEEAKSRYQQLKAECNHVYIIGISMGGLLALKLAQDFQPDGVIPISAPVFFNGFYNGSFIITDIRLFFSGIISLFVKKIKIRRRMSPDICPWEGYIGHAAVNCIHSIKIRTSKVRRRLYRVQSPACVIHADNDRTIPIENFYYILRTIKSTEKRGFAFKIPNENSSNHILTTHTMVKDRVFAYIMEFIQDCEKNFRKHPQELLGFKGNVRKTWRKFKRKVVGVRW
jgi:carboxylesterase